MNLGHTACPFAGHGILARYHLPGVRDQVRQILAQKRAAGYVWIRHMVWWHDGVTIDSAPSSWGDVPVQLPPPFDLNLRSFLTDARDAGFRLEVAMGPVGNSSPANAVLNPFQLAANKATILEIRTIAESVAPGTVYDLENEGGSYGDPEADLDRYVSAIWDWAEATFGLADSTISYHDGRWPRLLAALNPDPLWWETHVYSVYDVPPDGKDVWIGEHFADVPAPIGARVKAEAYWPLASTPDTDGDRNCTAAYTP